MKCNRTVLEMKKNALFWANVRWALSVVVLAAGALLFIGAFQNDKPLYLTFGYLLVAIVGGACTQITKKKADALEQGMLACERLQPLR